MRSDGGWKLGCAVLAVAALAGCAIAPSPPPPVTAPPAGAARYRAVAWDALPGWRDDRVQDSWLAFVVGCKALVARAATTVQWRAACNAASAIDGNDAGAIRAFYEAQFKPYAIEAPDGRAEGLVTGYYEPMVTGSRTATSRFGVPLYGVPEDLLTIDLASVHPELAGKRLRGRLDGRRVVPYWTRADIMNGRRPAARVLAYVDDPVDAFFLEVQGSGRVALTDGTTVRVGYADQNGHPYKAIGRVLVDRGALSLEQVSMQAIRAWAKAHIDEMPALLTENPSYVFFREIPPAAPGTLEAAIDGPIGALGVPLAAGRTIAVDPRSVPLGTPVFLVTTYPASDAELARVVLAHDTGGAIRGAIRADLFFGFGTQAGEQAGRMKQPGRMWMLWPRDAPLPGAVQP